MMCVCCSRASERCSSWSSEMTFRTTSRSASAGSAARYVLPEAPRPSSASSRNGPRSSPTSGSIGRDGHRPQHPVAAEQDLELVLPAREPADDLGGRRRPRPTRGGGRPPRRSAGRRPRRRGRGGGRGSRRRRRARRATRRRPSPSTSRETHDSSGRRSGSLGAGDARPVETSAGPSGRRGMGQSPSSSTRRAASDGSARDGQPPGQLVEDPANAPLVQSGPPGDLGVGQPLPLEDQDLAVGRRAFVEHPLPELVLLGDLAGPRLLGAGQVRPRPGRAAAPARSRDGAAGGGRSAGSAPLSSGRRGGASGR